VDLRPTEFRRETREGGAQRLGNGFGATPKRSLKVPERSLDPAREMSAQGLAQRVQARHLPGHRCERESIRGSPTHKIVGRQPDDLGLENPPAEGVNAALYLEKDLKRIAGQGRFQIH
jgi:hypothetical protein